MGFDLLNIKPHKVSRDLSGYITFVYGPPKTGKTTLASQMPDCLILAFERGYNALPGVIAQDVNSWGEMKQIYRELKKPEVQAVYKTIAVDTVDIAADLCQKYICSQLGIEQMGDGGWGTNSWTRYKKEFEEVFKPSIQSSALKIIENMTDLYGYAFGAANEDGTTSMKLMLRSPANSGISCGSRFKNIAPVIDFTYDALAAALTDAIESEAKEHNNEFVTDERENIKVVKDYDYDSLMKEFQESVGELMNKDQDYYSPRITQIVEKYLGKGKKMSGVTRDQAELVYLVVTDIKDELLNKK